MKYTANQLITLLPEPIRTELSAAMTAQQFDLDDAVYDDLPDLINRGISWDKTPQGRDVGVLYWGDVYYRALAGEFGAKPEPEPTATTPQPERVIPKGTRVRNLQHDDDFVKFGATGTVDEDASTPWVIWDNADMLTEYGQCDSLRRTQNSYYLQTLAFPDGTPVWRELTGDEWNDIAIVMMSRGLTFGVEALNTKLKEILCKP